MRPHSHASSINRCSQAQLKICRTGTMLGYGEAQAQAFLSSMAQQSLGRAQIPVAVQETTLLPAAQPIARRVWCLAGAVLRWTVQVDCASVCSPCSRWALAGWTPSLAMRAGVIK